MTHEPRNCVRCIPFALLLLCVSAGGCAPALMRSTASEPLTDDQIAQLWIEPEDIAARNLFWGSGGPATAPTTSVSYRVTAYDHSGYSRGYEVKSTDGREDGRIVFDYHARHGELFEDISPADVVWTCRLLSQLTDRQWRDAFRAANYADALAVRYIAKLRAKVEEGLTLMPQAGNNP